MSKIYNEKIIKRFESLVLHRFKNEKDLEDYINDNILYGLYCNDEELKVLETNEKKYYDNTEESDYEIMVVVGNDNIDLYDLTVYYAKTRIGDNIITEVGYEEV